MKILFLIIMAISFGLNALCQNEVISKKNNAWKLGVEYSIPGNGYGGCDYKVSGIGILAEREWLQSDKFSFLLSSGYQYYSGYTIDKTLGKKNFSYLYFTVAERLYVVRKLFVQGQLGLSTWGPIVLGGIGYRFRHGEAGISYSTVIVARGAECYKYANEEYLNFRVAFTF